MNREQEEEWTSVRCIYDGSDDVVLRPNDADAPEAEVQASVRIHPNVWVRLSIQLPEQYLNGEDSAVPIFWIESNSLTAEQMSTLGQHLDFLATSCAGTPTVFSWIEWLRTESFSALSLPSLEQPEAGALRENDALSPEPAPGPASCANCAASLSSEWVGLGCGHSFCRNCALYTRQVYAASEQVPCCPLPDCRREAAELDGLSEQTLWITVSEHLLPTRFQDCFVFCPGCEDRGMDIPVLESKGKLARSGLCQCFRCKHQFCLVCRSPWHVSESCFDSESRVVRMAKRRPPLSSDLAEMAATRAEEIRQQSMRQAELALSLCQTSATFNDLRDHFNGLYRTDVERGLSSVFGEVEIREVDLSLEVKDRFLAKLGSTGMGALRPAFHGTDPANYRSIFQHGLLIPGAEFGNKLRVVHGAAHGRGIYTANVDAAWLSKGFCTQASMLVCAVLDVSENVKHRGDAMVIFDPAAVVPLFEAGGTELSRPLGTAQLPAAALGATAKAAKAGQQAAQPAAKSQPDPPPSQKKKNKFLSKLVSQSKKR
ncbi:unnamed protein product [Effrenium voratum]|nr:unnamed protein product [Effrenium voratum]